MILSWQGANAEALIYDEGAPRTAAAFLALLPLDIRIVHVAWSGEMCMSVSSYDLNLTEPENSTRLVRPGDLTWDHRVGELGIVYGTAECRLPSGPNTVVVFGGVVSGLDRLAAMGRARRFEGVTTIRAEAS
ncbi:MAG: DUF3830 family protein [Bauldia sp.]